MKTLIEFAGDLFECGFNNASDLINRLTAYELCVLVRVYANYQTEVAE